MNDLAEKAHETIHEHGGHSDPWARRVAVLVSALAAMLALTEIGAKSTQNEYLTQHIGVSDDWAFYQARNLRAVMKETEVGILSHTANLSDAGVQAEIKNATDYAARMRDDPNNGDGMKQLMEKARVREDARDEAFHHYHIYEYAAGALEIAIVLASVSVVTRIQTLALAAGGIGVAAGVVALCTRFSLF